MNVASGRPTLRLLPYAVAARIGAAVLTYVVAARIAAAVLIVRHLAVRRARALSEQYLIIEPGNHTILVNH